MAASPDQLLRAVQTIEAQLTILKQALSEMGVKEEGLTGIFDGEAMVMDGGRRQLVPANYASKSMLVPGDTLRVVEDPAGVEQPRFKQIAKVERDKSVGLLTRKDGKFEVVCEQGSFKVLAAAIKHFEGEVGDQVAIQFARHHTKGSWAAVEKVIKTTGAAPAPQPLATLQPAAIAHQAEPAPVAIAPTPVAPPSIQPETRPVQSESKSDNRKRDNSKQGAAKSSSRNNRSKSSSSNNHKGSPVSQPTPKPATIRPAAPPAAATAFSPSQGEIVIPAVMDDDELA
jgi:hypothetical protein